MTIGKICSRSVELAQPEETAQAAARRMQERNVGTLVVLDARGQPVGILTDRDLALRVVATGLVGSEVVVEELMTRNPRTVREDAPIEEVVRTLRGLGVRRLLVVDDDNQLVGLASIDDTLELLASELQNLASVLVGGHPGSGLPATLPPDKPQDRSAPTEGLERATADLEC